MLRNVCYLPMSDKLRILTNLPYVSNGSTEEKASQVTTPATTGSGYSKDRWRGAGRVATPATKEKQESSG